VASWAGNLMLHKTHPDFPSDMVTILAAVQASISVSSSQGTTVMSIPDFLSTSWSSTSLITSLIIPFTPANVIFDTFKVFFYFFFFLRLIN
jgi:CO/xanthine dehydrogenase FAD-binding subunit